MTPEEMLFKAVRDRHYNGVRRAFEAKANITATDDIGWTSLHPAAYHGFDEIVDLLLSHDDVDVGLKTPQQETARDLAFLNYHDKIVQKLEAVPSRISHPSRVPEPKNSHVETSITASGPPRSLFE
jgi:ankyrin repeat protein